MVSDGVCATAEHLRRQPAVLQLEHHRQSVLNLDGQGRQAAEEGLSMQEREQRECNAGAWRYCGGRCDSAERLRHQVLSPSLAPSPLSLSLHPPLPFSCPPRPPPAPLSLSLKAIAAGGGMRRSWTCVAVTPLAMCSGRLGFPGEGSPARQSALQTIAGVACKRLQLQPRSSRLAHRAYLAARAAAKRRSKRQAAKPRSKSPALAQETRSPPPPPPHAPPPRLCQLQVAEARCDDAELENEVSRHGQEMTQAPGTHLIPREAPRTLDT
jgi:hypothetical protein